MIATATRWSCWLLVLAAGLGAAACGPSPVRCITDAECRQHGGDDAAWCVTGACRPCGDDGHCVRQFGRNWICESSQCVRAEGYCAGEPEVCPEHQTCRYGRCEPVCGPHARCADGQRCVDGRCTVHCDCVDDDDCDLAFACTDGCRCTLEPFGRPQIDFDLDERALTLAARVEVRRAAIHHAEAPVWRGALRLWCGVVDDTPLGVLAAERAAAIAEALVADGVAAHDVYVRQLAGGFVDTPAVSGTCTIARVRRELW